MIRHRCVCVVALGLLLSSWCSAAWSQPTNVLGDGTGLEPPHLRPNCRAVTVSDQGGEGEGCCAGCGTCAAPPCCDSPPTCAAPPCCGTRPTCAAPPTCGACTAACDECACAGRPVLDGVRSVFDRLTNKLVHRPRCTCEPPSCCCTRPTCSCTQPSCSCTGRSGLPILRLLRPRELEPLQTESPENPFRDDSVQPPTVPEEAKRDAARGDAAASLKKPSATTPAAPAKSAAQKVRVALLGPSW
jgi:hypothetical protein